MNPVKANLFWELLVSCPHCGVTNDLVDNDHDHIVACAIFSNRWDDLFDYEVVCQECGKDFEISEVVY